MIHDHVRVLLPSDTAKPPSAKVDALEHHVPTRSDSTLAAIPWAIPRAPDTASPRYLIAKRTLDIAASGLALIVLSPLLLCIIVLIRLTSRGPAFFRQQRVGEGGRIFTMYKFRSMYVGADHSLHQLAYAQFVQGNGGNGKVGRNTLPAHLHPQAATTPRTTRRLPARLAWLNLLLERCQPEDPRITPMGALLRCTSMDELPQLFNVLIGDMSLVGPRPPIPYEVRLYSPAHLHRLTVRPGLTGIWQVYARNRVPFEQMVMMDTDYIARRSFTLDLQLIALTIPSMVLSRSAK